jgi:hypothetical protein
MCVLKDKSDHLNHSLGMAQCLSHSLSHKCCHLSNTANQWTSYAVITMLYRICYTDSIGVQEDQYPPNIAVKVNQSYCHVPVSSQAGESHALRQTNQPTTQKKMPISWLLNISIFVLYRVTTHLISQVWNRVVPVAQSTSHPGYTSPLPPTGPLSHGATSARSVSGWNFTLLF